VLRNRMPRKILEPKRDKIKEYWENCYETKNNELMLKLYCYTTHQNCDMFHSIVIVFRESQNITKSYIKPWMDYYIHFIHSFNVFDNVSMFLYMFVGVKYFSEDDGNRPHHVGVLVDCVTKTF
jgi:hypothetical protein